MLIRGSVLLLAVLLLQPTIAATNEDIARAPAVSETKMALRDLWVEHVFWIRSYVLAVNDADDARGDVAEAEVIANAKALAAGITPFYGEDAADQFFTLLAGHWGAVKDYNAAAVAGAKDGQEQASAQIIANARDIARFLDAANPYLPEDVVFGLLAAHGAHHVSQIDQIAADAYAAEAKTWAAMRKHMLVIADSIAEGLARQFPERLVAQR